MRAKNPHMQEGGSTSTSALSFAALKTKTKQLFDFWENKFKDQAVEYQEMTNKECNPQILQETVMTSCKSRATPATVTTNFTRDRNNS